MAEIEKSTNAGESAARFIEFVMMQAQNASLFLGLIPHPQSGQPEPNLELARMFIDQLVMIQEKTRGNLSSEEQGILRNALSSLQMAYVEVARGDAGAAAPMGGQPEFDDEPAPAAPSPTGASPASPAPAPAAETPPAAPPAEESRESKKRFTKSYGA